MGTVGYIGKMPGMKLKNVALGSNDVIVGEYSMKKMDFHQVQNCYEILRDAFPDHQVLLLPSVVEIEAMTKQHLKCLKEMIQRVYL